MKICALLILLFLSGCATSRNNVCFRQLETSRDDRLEGSYLSRQDAQFCYIVSNKTTTNDGLALLVVELATDVYMRLSQSNCDNDAAFYVFDGHGWQYKRFCMVELFHLPDMPANEALQWVKSHLWIYCERLSMPREFRADYLKAHPEQENFTFPAPNATHGTNIQTDENDGRR